MLYAQCTEGSKHQPKISIDLCEGFPDESDSNQPYIDISLPDECWPDIPEYDGANIYFITLKDLLSKYLSIYWWHSHGEFTPRVISLLREYADKIEQDLAMRKST